MEALASLDRAPDELPSLRLGRGICDELGPGLRREWLVTNGLGGYAMGTLAGPATRAYHGYLVAASAPPVGRTLLVGGLEEWVTIRGRRVALHAHEREGRGVRPLGFRNLESFALDGLVPTWTYAFGDVRIEKRVWMANRSNTTLVRYDLKGADRAVSLAVIPLVTERDHHLPSRGDGPVPPIELLSDAPGGRVRFADGQALTLRADGGRFEPNGRWERGFRHREEHARGLADVSDLAAAGVFGAELRRGRPVTLVFSAEESQSHDGAAALEAELNREAELIRRANAADGSAFVRRLILAADQFLVERRIPAADEVPAATGRTVIAGYPWFTDWGRDTMISLAGLTLATGRADEAAAILRSFARFEADGLIPNHFPDGAGKAPAYNTADATLWFVVALDAYAVASADGGLVDELLPVVRRIVERHLAGTRFGIGVDPDDGLLMAGEPGVQLTWMDALVEGWVVTPRMGKPVEIQALWVNALRATTAWLTERNDPTAGIYRTAADRATESFGRRFWRPELGWLADVVDGPDGDDLALRPNQLLALSLPYQLLDAERGKAVLEACGRTLLTSVGLRSLAPSDRAYRGSFQGDRRHRDAAYHQGTVWSWLIGPYAEALARVTGDPSAGLAVLRPFEDHLADAGLGSISEIFEGDAPHEPRGCIAQAWGVAEVLRVWRALGGA